jgi:predicted HicB family RNase H-like nuclease
MTDLAVKEPMAKGRPKKPGGEGTPVRIDSRVYRRAKYVASARGIDLSDYLSNLLRSLVDRDFRKLGKELLSDEDE